MSIYEYNLVNIGCFRLVYGIRRRFFYCRFQIKLPLLLPIFMVVEVAVDMNIYSTATGSRKTQLVYCH